MFEIKSKIAEKVLGYYLINKKARHCVNELAKMLKLDPGNLDRKLRDMEKEGLLASEKQGNLKYFILNEKYPLFAEIETIYKLKYGVEKKVADSLKNLKGLKSAYIFGSYVKNKLNPESDIDILLIGQHSSLEAKRLISGLGDELRRELNIIDMTEKEFHKRKCEEDEFVKDVFKNKIIKIL